MKTEKNKTEKASDVEIVAYEPKYKNAFKTLNEEWIDTYFKLEDEDRKLLDDPKKNILDKGGSIIIALLAGEVIGTSALIPMENPLYEFEIGKMAVSPKARGKGIGELLGRAIIQKAKDLGAKSIYLESNTVLQAAINLYKKLGFQEVTGDPSPYARCNIQMELDLN
ncbi:MAG: GNAT superfamily N-acetyltransferase [Saprospiraceae bacterium]